MGFGIWVQGLTIGLWAYAIGVIKGPGFAVLRSGFYDLRFGCGFGV